MIQPIRLWPDPVLARPAAPVTAFATGLRTLAADMFETMYAAPGRGLAAPQVGVSLRLFVMDVTSKEGTKTPHLDGIVTLDRLDAAQLAALEPALARLRQA